METIRKREAWNKGLLVGQKPPLKPKDIWAIRIYLQNAHAVRDLAMFNLAIDSKLRGCDLVNLRVRDITHGSQVLSRAMVIQRKTQRPVQFELTEPTRSAVSAWLEKSRLLSDQYLFPSRVAKSPPRVQQLRAQVSEVIRCCFSNCHYSRVSCSGSRGFVRFNAAKSWACSVLVVDSPALGCEPFRVIR